MSRIIDAFMQFLDDNGDPLVNGWLAFKDSGTNTDKATYSDSALTVANTNPVQLDGAGRCPSVFGSGAYKVISYADNVVTPGTPGEQIQQFDPVGGDLEAGFFSTWVTSDIYTAGDVVVGSDGNYYRSLTSNNQANNPVTSPTEWEEVTLNQVWNVNVTYAAGDQVIGSDGLNYTSLVASNLGNDPTSDDRTNWTVATKSKLTEWESAATYTLGKAVTGSDGDVYYSATASNMGNDPVSDSGANWSRGSSFPISVRNCAVNQDPISQGTATRTGFEALLGTASSGISGATGLLTWKKDRNNVENHYLSSTLFGDFYLSSNTTAGLTATVPAATADDVTWQWRFDESTSGTTNRGQAYSAHYNAYLGCVLISVEGDGLAGHEVPHFMGNMAGRKWSAYIKNADAVGDWTSFSSESNSASGEHLELNTTAALATDAIRSLLVSDDTITLGSSSLINGSGNTIWIMLFVDVEGVSKVGKYIGTGAGGNYVDCGFKVGFLLVKNLSLTATNWVMLDGARGGANSLFPNLSNAEVAGAVVDFTDTGFVVNATSGNVNSVNDEFVFLAFADSGSGSTTYSYPTTDDTLTVNANTLLSFANGFNSSGEVNTQELVGAGITATLGAGFENKHLWMYKDKAGSYGFSEYRPLEGITRDDADKWGVVSSVDPSLRTTAKHFDYESATGVASVSVEDSGSEIWRALNKDSNDIITTAAGANWLATGSTSANITYKLDEKRIPKSLRLRETGNTTYTPLAFTVSGSNDGLTKTVLHTETTYAGNGVSLWGDLIDLSAVTTAYQYLHIDVTSVNGGANIGLAEIEFNTVTPSDYYLVNEGQMYNSSDVAIERIYLAEVRTGGSGDVTYLRNLPVAKAKADSGEFQGGLKVHGEIENRGVCTAWVNFDGTQNPPLIIDSHNVLDVIDMGTGVFDVVPDPSIDVNRVGVTATANGNARNAGVVISGNRVQVAVAVTTTGASSDPARCTVEIKGGKEIK